MGMRISRHGNEALHIALQGNEAKPDGNEV